MTELAIGESTITARQFWACVSAARASRDAGELLRLGGELERQGVFAEAWALLAEGGEIRKPPTLMPWNGPGASGDRLLVRRRIRHLGAELRNARFIARATVDVPHVLVATEPRLIPLLSRSFPQASFVDASDEGAMQEADCETSYERLAGFYGPTHETIEASFQRLVPHPGGAASEGLGIAWHSTNRRKQLPSLADWAHAIGTAGDRVQSLQYDEDEARIDQLEKLAGRPVGRSPLDQKLDVDGFAALVASVRSVLTISNTTAHMAGALGVPCVVVLDDLEHLTWPARQDRTPFYPRLRIVQRRGRPWSSVLQHGLAALRELVSHEDGDRAYAHQ